MRDDTHRPRNGQDPSVPRHLILVHPAPPRKPRTRTRAAPPFSPEEQARLRAALKTARGMFGSWACLAAAMGLPDGRLPRLGCGTRRMTGDNAIRLARALGVPLESLLRGVVGVPKTCPTCGRGGAS